MKLRTKFGIALLVVTLVLSTATYGGLELFKQQTLEQNRDSVDESAELAAAQIAGTVEERRDYIGYVASRPEAANFSGSAELVGGVVNNSRFFAAQVVAANGTVVAFGGQIDDDVRRRTLGSDVSDEPYFVEAQTRSSYVTEPESVATREQYLVVISAPILTDDGLQGVFAASIYVSTETFLNPVATLNTQGQRVTVTDGDAVLLDSGESFERTTTGEASVDGLGWTVTVERDRSQLNEQLRTLAVAQGVGLLLVLLAVVAFWMWEYRTNLQQTERLLEGFSKLQAGRHDHRLDLHSGEEWEQISNGFNDLASGLAARETAVHEREQRLEVLNRVLRHNLRNDMNVILGYAELLEDETDRDLLTRAAGTIRQKGSHLVDLSQKARWIDEGLDDASVERQRLDAVDLLERLLGEIDAEYPAVDLEASLPPAAPIYAASSVGTAIGNVVENACEHNDAPDPRVDVSLDVDGTTVRVRVADNGPGIPDHERDVLEAGEETPLEHGSGVGLWVARWLVDHSGGRIEFEENEPRGAVVTLAFERPPESTAA